VVLARTERDDVAGAIELHPDDEAAGMRDAAGVAVDDAEFGVVLAEDESVADRQAARAAIGEIACFKSAPFAPAKSVPH
jgi:hypothetical protein